MATVTPDASVTSVIVVFVSRWTFSGCQRSWRSDWSKEFSLSDSSFFSVGSTIDDFSFWLSSRDELRSFGRSSTFSWFSSVDAREEMLDSDFSDDELKRRARFELRERPFDVRESFLDDFVLFVCFFEFLFWFVERKTGVRLVLIDKTRILTCVENLRSIIYREYFSPAPKCCLFNGKRSKQSMKTKETVLLGRPSFPLD